MRREAAWEDNWSPPLRKNFRRWGLRLWVRIPTSNMLKAGADHGATGENAVAVGCRKADLIIGPVGIAIADSMYGEITPAMAAAVGQSDAKKLLIPMNQCNNIIVGVKNVSMNDMIGTVIGMLRDEIMRS